MALPGGCSGSAGGLSCTMRASQAASAARHGSAPGALCIASPAASRLFMSREPPRRTSSMTGTGAAGGPGEGRPASLAAPLSSSWGSAGASMPPRLLSGSLVVSVSESCRRAGRASRGSLGGGGAGGLSIVLRREERSGAAPHGDQGGLRPSAGAAPTGGALRGLHLVGEKRGMFPIAPNNLQFAGGTGGGFVGPPRRAVRCRDVTGRPGPAVTSRGLAEQCFDAPGPARWGRAGAPAALPEPRRVHSGTIGAAEQPRGPGSARSSAEGAG